MTVSARTYEQVALEDPDGQWELDCGHLRRKPPMTFGHSVSMYSLNRQLIVQLDPNVYEVSTNTGRLRVATGSFYVPDVFVIPREFVVRGVQERSRELEVYDEAVPLVVEVWSPSTGDYDVEVKLAAYQQRGDREIWRIHPYERTLTAWRLQPDGSYTETVYHEGIVEPVALPGVRIALADLFA